MYNTVNVTHSAATAETCWATAFVKRFALCYRTVVCPVSDVDVLWPNGWMEQDAAWYGDRSWPRPHCIRWGPSSPRRVAQQPPLFGPCVLWPNGWMDQDATWYGDRRLGPANIVLDEDEAPYGKGHSSPHFSAHFARSPISATADVLFYMLSGTRLE